MMTMERKDVMPILGQCLDGELHLLALRTGYFGW